MSFNKMRAVEAAQVETVSHALLREAEDSGDEEPGLPAWQKHEWISQGT